MSVVQHAVGLPTVGEFGDVRALPDLAVAVEERGWDGVHLWDHLLCHQRDWPVTSSVVAASAIAASTSRIRIVLTGALPRRQVQDVAQDTAAPAALGSMDREYADFGLDPDLRARRRGLDERLGTLTELWDRWGAPPIPVWCAGRRP
ncbi:hypothetical protein Ade02nite_47310 [Paractinoplanes deccanensis]|uniref:Luciferase-like domain-containing protein n=1 Tax=Paractinoplanes deccanensis TaxID=113561 RepID=A0ABQ3Y817_9ACTN|nr:LLM class flavin-dependent oxidoreductase [Actinoplanes deccanensis]GID76090.1 hypothetical protein Ade02nite_47310 [Actinoplanes deccanensis]